MIEQLIHGILLAFHNIALVGCAAAPFYNRNLVTTRAQYGPKLHYKLDKVVEDTLQGNAPYCIAFIITLFVTGIGIPLNHFAFAGSFKAMHLVASIALTLKLLSVFAMVTIMIIIFSKINPRLRAIFADFKPDAAPQPALETEFFALRARRKTLCDKCLIFAVGILVFSAFMGFN